MKKIILLAPFLCLVTGAAMLCVAQENSAPAGGAAPAANQGAPNAAGRRGGLGRGAFGRGGPPGPPAPVPPEVTMLRPTAEEVAKINAVLKQFVETNNSPEK